MLLETAESAYPYPRERISVELTQAQKDQFPQFLEKWMAHGLSREPSNRPNAEHGVALAYEAAKLTPPTDIYWLGSPLAGALVDTAINKLSADTTTPVPPRASRPKQKYTDRVLAVVDTALPIVNQILSKAQKKAVKREFLIDCLSDLRIDNAAYGQYDAAILCFYDFFAQVCGVEECRKLEGLNLIAKSCSWWWAYDSVAILTERPQKLSFDDRGRFHSDSDWALLYPDGFGYCLVHGVEVPEHIVLDPSKITVKEIEEQANVEVRRVMIEKYGQSRYLIDSGAKLLHKDDWGELYRKEVADDEPIHMVKVVNSTPESDGSFKDYFIRTPPTLNTARDSVAWTFAQEGAKYQPQVET